MFGILPYSVSLSFSLLDSSYLPLLLDFDIPNGPPKEVIGKGILATFKPDRFSASPCVSDFEHVERTLAMTPFPETC